MSGGFGHQCPTVKGLMATDEPLTGFLILQLTIGVQGTVNG